jgi:dCMP deaminase
MRIAISGDEARVVAAAHDLATRSVDIVTLGAVPLARVLQTLEAHRHYALLGDLVLADALPLLAEHRIPLVYLGAAPVSSDPTWARALHEHAALKLDGVFEETLDALRRYVVGEMAAFERPDWDDYFMRIAHVVALRSNCLKRKVAAVMVRDRCVIATGYNGTPRGAKNCNEGGCPRCSSLVPAGHGLDDCLCNHAEENAVAQAAFHGVSVRDATLYCTYSPCLHCTKLLINAGVREVVYNAAYPLGDRALLLFEECGVKVRQFVSEPAPA